MKISEFRKLIREEVRKVIAENQDNIVSIGDNAARTYGMDMEELQNNVEDEYNFAKYREGIDYEWNTARGDDFPHAITIKNVSMMSDPKVKKFLDWIGESRAKGYQ